MKPKLTPEEARKDHKDMLIFLAINCAIGIVTSWVVTAGIFYFDIAGLWTSSTRSSSLYISILLLAFPLSLLFGGAAMATAIMTMPYERKYRDHGQ